MRKLNLIISIAFLGFILASCSSTRVTNRNIGRYSSSVVQRTLIADVKVDLKKKITGEATINGGSATDARNMAVWNAIEGNGAHMIIDPVFKFVASRKRITCSVIGFHGVFENIKTATEQDLLNYIRVSLLSGTGILAVSFQQFNAFYRSLVEGQDIPEENIMDEEELRSYYNGQVRLAKVLNLKNRNQGAESGIDAAFAKKWWQFWK